MQPSDAAEETFRPWLSEIPVAADEMYLVAREFTMADGSRHQGFATPAFEPDDMGLIQPSLFALRKEVCFLVWDVSPARRNQSLLYGFCQRTYFRFSPEFQRPSGINDGILFRNHPRIYGEFRGRGSSHHLARQFTARPFFFLSDRLAIIKPAKQVQPPT
jgi:hypothetical protein